MNSKRLRQRAGVDMPLAHKLDLRPRTRLAGWTGKPHLYAEKQFSEPEPRRKLAQIAVRFNS